MQLSQASQVGTQNWLKNEIQGKFYFLNRTSIFKYFTFKLTDRLLIVFYYFFIVEEKTSDDVYMYYWDDGDISDKEVFFLTVRIFLFIIISLWNAVGKL